MQCAVIVFVLGLYRNVPHSGMLKMSSLTVFGREAAALAGAGRRGAGVWVSGSWGEGAGAGASRDDDEAGFGLGMRGGSGSGCTGFEAASLEPALGLAFGLLAALTLVLAAASFLACGTCIAAANFAMALHDLLSDLSTASPLDVDDDEEDEPPSLSPSLASSPLGPTSTSSAFEASTCGACSARGSCEGLGPGPLCFFGGLLVFG